ncbi:MAG TPA: tyrosine-protein phosphatase [Chloroflexia bacterium]|nr:tyrosine-protein phosphatase [Chloroflexia bacterium]
MESKISLQRRIELEGLHNLRDLGGYPTHTGRTTRWGRIYRSDSPERLLPPGQQALVEQGVAVMIDLRTPYEVSKFPSVFAPSQVVKYHHMPVLKDDDAKALGNIDEVEAINYYVLDACQSNIREVMSRIASSQPDPVLIHCVAGKDRTGLISALMLGLAGVPAEVIAEDYALSHSCLTVKIEEWRAEALAAGKDMAQFERNMACAPETMLLTLDYLKNNYGGVEGYSRFIGLSEDEIETLKATLVE